MDLYLIALILVLGAGVLWLRRLRREPLPGSLGALFARLGLDWSTLARVASVREFADGIERCAQCRTKDDCGRWLASGQREGYQRFCPNAEFVERIARRKAR